MRIEEIKSRDRQPDYHYTVAQLAAATGGRIVRGLSDEVVRGFSTDSRNVPESWAFCALVGTRHDAHDFVPDVLRGGAAAVVVERLDPAWQVPARCAVLLVPDTTLALRDLARFHRRHLTTRTLSITGSCGKSTVKTFAAALLGELGETSAPPESFNNRIGVSLTILGTRLADDYLVTELGANHPGEIDELAGIAQPHAGVLTIIGEAHLEGFGSIEGVREAKAELLRHISPCGTLVINGENEHCRLAARRFAGHVVTFGFGRENDYFPEAIEVLDEGTCFRVRGTPVRLRTPGRFNILNALAAIAGCEGLGADALNAADVLAHVTPLPLRSRVTRLGEMTFLEDCYNNNATAILSALDLFDALTIEGRRIVVCGDMLEMGSQSERIHRRVGGELARRGVDVLIGFGQFGRFMAQGFARGAGRTRQCFSFTADQLPRMCGQLQGVLDPGCGVLIKGSRGMRMERVLEMLKTSIDPKRAAGLSAA